MSDPTLRRKLLLAGLASPLLSLPGCAGAPARVGHGALRVRAPFDMPAIGVPDFAGAPRFLITDFGAVQHEQRRTTSAIAGAITAAHAHGAGIVVVPQGTWQTGPIHLKSNVNLHVARGATLLFSEKPQDYLPAVPTSWEGLECHNYSPLVYAFDCDNVAITGGGTLRARLDIWKLWYARPPAHMAALVKLYHQSATGVPVAQRQMATGEANLRPHFIQFNRCRHVLVEDVRIEDSPFWVLHPYLCRDVVIRRVQIRAHGHNSDGVDPEMSQNVLIEDCVFDQGDDAISVKAGRDRDAWRIGVPSRNIVMRNCRIRNGHQLVAIGSELSGGIENVFVDECHFDHAGSGAPGTINNILFVKANERRGGYVRNIHVSNVTATAIAGGLLSVETDVLYQWKDQVPTCERRLTPIEGLYLSNVRVDDARFICRIKGEAELPVRRVVLRNASATRVRAAPLANVNVTAFKYS